MYDILIKDGLVVLPHEVRRRDIAITNEKIAEIGHFPDNNAALVINALGKIVLPGGVDVHTHMDLHIGYTRAVDNFYTGSLAALCGGTTTIIDHIAFGPPNCSLHYELNAYRQLARSKAMTDYAFHGVLQYINESIIKEFSVLKEEGVPSFKAYMTYHDRLSDDQLQQALQALGKIGSILTVHAEDHDIITDLRNHFAEANLTSPMYHALSRPDSSEAVAVEKVLRMARQADDAPIYLVHISTKASLEKIRTARAQGQKNIYAETCPQYLLLDSSRYLEKDNGGLKYIMAPPLRSREDNQALWQGLAAGELQVVATDHCPFNFNGAKQRGKNDFQLCPGGAPGVEERLLLMYWAGVQQNRLTPQQFVEVCCANPAKIFGIYPQKGAILPGSDADIVLLDPQQKTLLTQKNMHSAADYCTYEGMEVDCSIDLVIRRGQIVNQNGKCTAIAGSGQQLSRYIKPEIISTVPKPAIQP